MSTLDFPSLKPSEIAPATAEVIARFLPEYMDREDFSVVLGAVPETTALLECRWDHVFFTGGTTVATIVMTAAAKHLTPVVLELGGKSPTIVHSSANVRVAARCIAQGRWGNAGQTCTAPDYVLVFKELELSSVPDVIDFINARPSPLGLYVFAEDPWAVKQILDSTSSGAAAVNECTVHPIIHDFPFGGVGQSGMGRYHGDWGFRAYTNARGVLRHSARVDPRARYPPYERHQLLRRMVMPS
jgi:acyl-CoA reductase-like NAD-dependent aldehyde dehydrogenase